MWRGGQRALLSKAQSPTETLLAPERALKLRGEEQQTLLSPGHREEKRRLSNPGGGVGNHPEARPLESPSAERDTGSLCKSQPGDPGMHGLPKAGPGPGQRHLLPSHHPQSRKYGVTSNSSLLQGPELEPGERPSSSGRGRGRQKAEHGREHQEKPWDDLVLTRSTR